MTYEQMKRTVRSQLKEVLKTRDAGQKEYAHDIDNVFANFERCASLLDISREKALMVYFLSLFIERNDRRWKESVRRKHYTCYVKNVMN